MRLLIERIENKAEMINGLMSMWDGEQEWYNKPKPSYSGSEAKTNFDNGNYDWQKVTADIKFESRYTDGGIYFANFDLNKYAPYKSPEIAEPALTKWVGKNRRSLEAGMKKWIEMDGKVSFDVFGYRESQDWEIDMSSMKLKSVKYGSAKVDRNGRTVAMPFTMKVEFRAKKKPDEKDKPFSKMSDRELDKLIDIWASEAPENFWMDGEWQGTAAQRKKQLRGQWRAMRPRDQVRMYNNLMSQRY